MHRAPCASLALSLVVALALTGPAAARAHPQAGQGSVRVGLADHARLACAGVTAPDVFAYTWSFRGEAGWTAPTGRDAGLATVNLWLVLATYPAPGGDLPRLGDPGYLYAGRTTFHLSMRLSPPPPGGAVLVPVEFPLVASAADGSGSADLVVGGTVAVGSDAVSVSLPSPRCAP